MESQLTYLMAYIDAKESALIAVYAKNKRYAFWHNVGTTALGALATALLGFSALDAAHGPYYKGVTLILTMSITIFVSCDQFFRFRSRADAAHLTAANLCDLREEIDLKTLNSGGNDLDDEEIDALTRRARAIVKNADLLAEAGSVWRGGIDHRAVFTPRPLP